MELPREKVPASAIDPKFLILFGKPKSGKTTIVSLLPDNLIIDLENGSDYIDALKVKAPNIDTVRQVASTLAKDKKEGFQYKFITIDTGTALEDVVKPYALELYRATPMGKNFGLLDNGTYEYKDITTLPNGAGYLYLREAYKKIIQVFKEFPSVALILIGHTADKLINEQGKELSRQELDLTGKLSRIIPADADGLGYVYRKKNQTIINFKGGGDSLVESRSPHLRNQEIVIAESNEEGDMTAYWEKIFTTVKF